MSSDPLPPLDGVVVVILILVFFGLLGFSCYRALVIRRALVSRVYRSRALWTGVFGVLLIPFSAGIFLPPSGPAPTGLIMILENATAGAVWLVGLFFLDRTILVAREMDFFHRDSLHWRSARKFVWGITIIGIVGNTIAPSGILSDVTGLMWTAPLGYYAIVLAVTSLRIRDRVMRNFTKWLGLFAAVFTILFLLPPSFPYFSMLVLLVVDSFFFYRAVESLSMKSRIENET